VKTRLQKQLLQRKRKMLKRIDRFSSFTDCHILGSRVKYELSEKQQAIACGGLGTIPPDRPNN